MRRPYHRVGGRSPFDGLEGGRGAMSTDSSSWRLRFSARKLYVLLAFLLVVTAAVRLAGLILEATFQVEHVPEPRQGGGPFGSSYTIRVNTFRRNDMLKGFLRHFSTCPNVHAIQVVWSDQDNKPPPMEAFDLPSAAQVAKVHFEEQPTDSLNNRFRNLSFVPTPAVLSLDDDLEIPCDVLDFAYSVWQASPQSLVGFTPRLITWEEPTNDQQQDARGGYRYQSSFKYVWWHGRYNLVLTKCCFLHRDFLPLYFSSLSSATLRYIDEHRNCEDIAMQFVVSNQTRGTPPVWVQARFTDHGQTSGISQGRDHAGERSACIAHLVKEFHHLPLTSTTHKAVDARRQWIW